MATKLLTINEVLKKSSEFLTEKGVPSPKSDTEWLVASLLNCSRIDLFLNYEEVLSEQQLNQIRKLVISRGKRIPLQHLLGKVPFCNLSLSCDSRALIPRPETEELVEVLLNRIPSSYKGNIVDLGTGSGAILLALCSSLPNCFGFGLEKCAKAISLAKENILACGLTSRVSVSEFNWVTDKLPNINVDIIISNPPYLSKEEWQIAEPEVRDFDPYEALVSNDAGLYDLLQIIKIAKAKLSKGGYLALEFGVEHAEKIESAAIDSFSVEIIRDLQKQRRFALCIKK
jgi:release factor glutamine methyltransferase